MHRISGMNHRFCSPVCAALLLLIPMLAHAQTATQRDAEIGQAIQQGYGVVFMDSNIVWITHDECSHVNFAFTRPDDNTRLWVNIRNVSWLGAMIGQTWGGVRELPPGDYILDSIECGGGNRFHLNGPHARFQVRAREVVNIGMLKIIMSNEQANNFMGNLRAAFNPSEKQQTQARRSVEPLSPRAVAYFKETAPNTFARATARPMTLFRSAHGLVREKGRVE
jgi:hypothetical protein